MTFLSQTHENKNNLGVKSKKTGNEYIVCKKQTQ